MLNKFIGSNFDCVLADPPWQYKAKDVPMPRGFGKSSVDYYYKTMPIDCIQALPLREITSPDCVCFLWATNPLMPEAFGTLKAWGFSYKTMLTWEKENSSGMGYWFRGVTEHVLLGVKGDVKAFRSMQKNLIRNKIGRHSAKPHKIHDIIEAVTPNAKRLELFARYKRANWTVFGNQVETDLLSEVM